MDNLLRGTIIKESLADEAILGRLKILDVQIWKSENHTPSQPAYWTAISFSADTEGFPAALADALKPEWYVDMSDGREKFIVPRVIRYLLGDGEGEKRAAGMPPGCKVPETQIDGKNHQNKARHKEHSVFQCLFPYGKSRPVREKTATGRFIYGYGD